MHKLFSFRKPEIDHFIELKKINGKILQTLWKPLYNIFRDELLILRKILNDYLNKKFIKVSNSSVVSSVLFVWKPDEKLRFCVNYHALNKFTRKNHYSLSLIHETLNNISKTKWFTKLNIITVFHKLCITENDEWLMAFHTKYELFEWLIIFFDLTNATNNFQWYINWILREYLDKFVSTYLNNIFIYTDDFLSEHRNQVRKVLTKLQTIDLYVDINKCKFEHQIIKYLEFIVEAGQNIKMNFEKIVVIRE